MKRAVIAFFLCVISVPAFASKELVESKIDGKSVSVVKVTLDGNTRIVTPYAEDGGETFENLLKKAGSDTGINGAYFCPEDYKWCGKTYTNADRAYEGKQNFKFGGDFGAKGFFGFDANDKPLFVLDNVWYGKGIDRSYNVDKKKELKNGISNIPVLLLEGKNILPESESEIDAKMRASSAKSFICSNEKGDTVYFGTVTSATIYEMPDFIKKNFGCYQAIGLDNGGSMGMSYEGRVIRKPGRKIMDAFAVVEATPAQKRENAAVAAKVSAFNAKVAGQIRAMKKKGATKAQVDAWKNGVRNSLSASLKTAEAKYPAGLDVRVMKGMLTVPALAK